MDIPDLSAMARTRIRKPPTDVFNAFADADQMSKFWFTRRDDGLHEGEAVTWYLGSGEDAFAFDVQVKELSAPDRLVIEWAGPDGQKTTIVWSFEEAADGNTILSIKESGFRGDRQHIIERALDSTGGFNQVIIAAKALIEHGVAINVVDDHA